MISGNKLVAQFGKESAFPNDSGYTIPTMTRQVRLISESLNDSYNKTEEGVLTGGKGRSKSVVTSNIVDGGVNFLARPDDLGLFLKMAFGSETVAAVTGSSKYKHTFTCNADTLPNMAILLDKLVNTYVYEGCKVNTIEFAAAPEDYLKINLTIQGFKVEGGQESKKGTLTPSSLNAFMFSGATVSLESEKIADVTNIRVTLNNNLQSEITTDTGIRRTEATPSTREINTEVECIYSADSDAITSDYYQQDTDVSLEISFVAGTDSLKFIIPANNITNSSAPFDGADGRHQSLSLSAFENGTDELITVELINDIPTVY